MRHVTRYYCRKLKRNQRAIRALPRRGYKSARPAIKVICGRMKIMRKTKFLKMSIAGRAREQSCLALRNFLMGASRERNSISIQNATQVHLIAPH